MIIWKNQLVDMMLPFWDLPFGAKSSLCNIIGTIIWDMRELKVSEGSRAVTLKPEARRMRHVQHLYDVKNFQSNLLGLDRYRYIDFVLDSDRECGKAATGRP